MKQWKMILIHAMIIFSLQMATVVHTIDAVEKHSVDSGIFAVISLVSLVLYIGYGIDASRRNRNK